MRYLKYFHVWENCYHSEYGKKTALHYAEPNYCIKGMRYKTETDELNSNYDLCSDWHKCQMLNKSLK